MIFVDSERILPKDAACYVLHRNQYLLSISHSAMFVLHDGGIA